MKWVSNFVDIKIGHVIDQYFCSAIVAFEQRDVACVVINAGNTDIYFYVA